MSEHYGVSKSTVARWFGIIAQRAIRRSTFSSVKQLTGGIDGFVSDYNAETCPFV